MKMSGDKLLHIVLLVIILIIAGFFRFWQLDQIPAGLYQDEVINLEQAVDEPGKIFYKENHGREGLFINLVSLSFSIYGMSLWSFKIVPALIGALTVLSLYLLTKQILIRTYLSENKGRIIALLASFFIAISFWHVMFSRIGFRAILLPLILCLCFYFIFRGLHDNKNYNFVIAGILFGLGFYSYLAFRIVLLPILFLIVWKLINRKINTKKINFKPIIYFCIFALIISLPLIIYFLQNPVDFMSKANSVSIFATKNPFIEFGKSLVAHFFMFNFYGDPNWRHNIAYAPVLLWPLGILLISGIVIIFNRLITDFKKHQNFTYNFKIFGFLLFWWLIMLLPGILTYENVPSSIRCIGAIPPTFIMTAIAAEFIYSEIKRLLKNYRFVPVILLFGLLTFLLITQYQKYFIAWGQDPKLEMVFPEKVALEPRFT